ncbi:unnamed protein product [Eruca vesicaria subsp. sativa]|uniref:Uncharacterized protein n=1 Tax=Eruca vesicaria subsp. sativa TaxID=29727 RepID=A0ABC8LZF4_ERUVS|nr:unnamed protein product [Eruca vesicaria subsp. sativa]
MGKENQLEAANRGVNDHNCPPVKNEELAVEALYSTHSDSGLPTCRVCHSAESDKRGDAALGITPPVLEARKSNADQTSGDVSEAEEKSCYIDIEMGIKQHQDALIELGFYLLLVYSLLLWSGSLLLVLIRKLLGVEFIYFLVVYVL